MRRDTQPVPPVLSPPSEVPIMYIMSSKGSPACGPALAARLLLCPVSVNLVRTGARCHGPLSEVWATPFEDARSCELGSQTQPTGNSYRFRTRFGLPAFVSAQPANTDGMAQLLYWATLL